MAVSRELKSKGPAVEIVVIDLHSDLEADYESDQDEPPDRPCWLCGGRVYWWQPGGRWPCQACHPCPLEGERVEWHTVEVEQAVWSLVDQP